MTARPAEGAPAVTRAIAVLGALASRGPLTATSLARLLALQKSSIADVCTSLIAEEMILRRRDGAYMLGPRLERLGAALGNNSRLFELFDRAVAHEASLDGMTLTLDVLRGAEVICLAARLGRIPLPATPRPGLRTAGLTSAPAQAITRAIPPQQLQDMLLRFADHQSLPRDHVGAMASGEQSEPSERSWLVREAPNGAWHVAAAVPSLPDLPLFVAVVVHLPAAPTTAELVDLGAAAVRCADKIGEGARRAARLAPRREMTSSEEGLSQ